MSRYTYSTSTLERAGFYLPFSRIKLYPELLQFMDMSQHYDYIPLYAAVECKNFDVVSFFQAMNTSKPSCLLESLTGNDNGRYSIIACEPLHEISSTLNAPQGILPLQNLINSLRIPELQFPFFTGGLVGYWSYETGLYYQGLLDESAPLEEQYFFMPGKIIVYDRYTFRLSIFLWIRSSEADEAVYESLCRQMKVIITDVQLSCETNKLQKRHLRGYEPKADNIAEEFQVNISDEKYEDLVRKAQEHIRQGDIFQVVLSRRWCKKSNADPWQVYLRMRSLNPSPYMFYFKLPEGILLGASPEMQVKVREGKLKSRPIAGTRKVTGDKELDELLQEELLNDEKERAEHIMLVDLSRNDVGRVCRAGSVRVLEFMKLEKYSHVVHLVSTVEGKLKEDVSSLEAFKACFPAGTLSGAPKHKAMEIIKDLEPYGRGPYGGSVGYISFAGSLDSCITIRAVLYKNKRYYLQSGAGIVADSIPEMEAEETLNKARVLMLAIKRAEELE